MAKNSVARWPSRGTWNQEHGDGAHQGHVHEADEGKGDRLAEDEFHPADGGDHDLLHGPDLPLRTTAMLERMMEMIMTSSAMTPGRKKNRLSRFGLNQVREAMVTGSAPTRTPLERDTRSSRMWLL